MGLFNKKKEPEKRESEFNEIVKFHNLSNGFSMIIFDGSKTVIEVNNEFLKVFGYPIEGIKGKHFDILKSTFHTESFYHSIWSTLEKGEVFSEFLNLKAFKSNFIYCRFKIFPIHDKSNNIRYLALLDPIETNSNIDENIGNSYNLLLEAVNNNPDIICFKDGEGRWLFANQADIILFHLEGVDYKGKTDADLAAFTHPMYKESFLNCMVTDEKCWQKKEISRGDEMIKLPNGSQITLDVYKIPVFHENGSRKNLIVIGRDVTSRREAEKDLKEAKIKAEESDRLKSAFLATMSHELRTPLNAVMGFASLINDETNLNEIHDFSRIINNNARMLLNLIEDLFDVSLIESGQMQISKQDVDLVRIVKEVYEIFPVEINLLDKLDVKFLLNISHEKLMLHTDGFRVKQIITNLVRNALKFTEKGHISITLSEEKDMIHITVEDTGIGIPEDKLALIFEMFRQVEDGSRRRYGGAGLGLAISKNLSDLLGGNLLAHSELNKGSQFILQLPIQ